MIDCYLKLLASKTNGQHDKWSERQIVWKGDRNISFNFGISFLESSDVFGQPDPSTLCQIEI